MPALKNRYITPAIHTQTYQLNQPHHALPNNAIHIHQHHAIENQPTNQQSLTEDSIYQLSYNRHRLRMRNR